MTSWSAPRVAWALWVLASAVLLIGAAINVIEPLTIDPNLPSGRALLLSAPLLVLIELAFPTLGAIVIAHHPRNAVGWLIYVGGMAETIRFTTKAVGSLVDVRGDVLSLGGAMSLLRRSSPRSPSPPFGFPAAGPGHRRLDRSSFRSSSPTYSVLWASRQALPSRCCATASSTST